MKNISEIKESLTESIKEVKLHKEGKLELRSAYELFDEF